MLFPSCRRLPQSLLALAGILFAQVLLAQQAQIELSEAIVAASNLFVSGLDAQQRERASFDFNDEERLNWHFIPRAREGVTLKELSPEQLLTARKLLQTLFSRG